MPHLRDTARGRAPLFVEVVLMKRPALVSVVIPCYRQAHFLADAIDSVLAQTYPDIQALVVDDGSPDDTAAVAARYPRVRYFKQPNAGLAAARNAGLAYTDGEFVVFLDADDRLLPGGVGENASRLAASPALAFVAGHSRYISRDGSPLSTHHRPPPRGDLHAALLSRNQIRMPGMVMFRRRALQIVGGFDTRINACADYDMYLRITRRFPVHFHDVVVAEYRKHGENMSDNAALMLRQLAFVMREQRRHLGDNDAWRAAWREGWRNICDYYGDRVANSIRERVRARTDWRGSTTDALTLLALHPRGLLTHALRKAVHSGRKIAGGADEHVADASSTG